MIERRKKIMTRSRAAVYLFVINWTLSVIYTIVRSFSNDATPSIISPIVMDKYFNTPPPSETEIHEY